MTAAAFKVGAAVRVISGNLEGAVGTVFDADGGLPELPNMIRIAVPGAVPPRWWVALANLEKIP